MKQSYIEKHISVLTGFKLLVDEIYEAMAYIFCK
jgi:hypothetical protein